MAIELAMPALSPSMEKGTLARWLVAEGDVVTIGDQLAEIETDKATMELEADYAGRVIKLVVRDGTDDVAVGTVIAIIAADDGEAAMPMRESAAIAAPPTPAAAIATPAPAAPPAVDPAVARPHGKPADRIGVSPLAQRIADAKGIDLTAIAGSGRNGRIVRADLHLPALGAISPAREPHSSAPPSVSTAPPDGVPVDSVALSTMRKTIGRRLSASKQTIPHFYLTVRCNLEALLALRTELNDSLAARDIKLSVNDLLIKAMALALVRVPDANVQFGSDTLHRFGRVDIAMAVAIDGGLVTPVITDAGNRSLSAIAGIARALTAKARDGQLAPADYQGGTASISNLGMFGIDEMVPVINPPQALILGIGAGVEQPWKVDGQMALATVMAATASFDHRAIDGATAAQFMRAFRELVENPLHIIS